MPDTTPQAMTAEELAAFRGFLSEQDGRPDHMHTSLPIGRLRRLVATIAAKDAEIAVQAETIARMGDSIEDV